MNNRFFFWILFFVFFSLPLILFYNAFYLGNAAFKDTVNHDVEFYYALFMLIGILFAAFITKFVFDRKRIQTEKKTRLLLLLKAITVFYGIFLVFVSTSRFISYRSEAVDLMFFKQELWQLSTFTIPAYQWSQHFSPVLFALVPFFWLTKSGAFLMFIQAACVVSGAIPLYLASKAKLHSQFLGIALVIAYLSFGGLQFGFAYGFHEIMFFPPLFFWAYYFLIKNHLKRYVLFVLLCLFVKEEVSFIMIFWGLFLLTQKKYRYACITIGLGIVWYILCFYLIFPHFNHGVGFGYWGQYPGANNGIFGLITFALFHPGTFLERVLTPQYKIDTIFHSFGHFSFLSFLYPQSLIMVIPSLFEKLLSNDIAAKNGFHYSASITAVVAVSVIESLYSLQKKKFLSRFIEKRNVFFGLLMIYVACTANVLYGYHPLSPLLLGREGGLSDQQLWVLNQTLDALPPNTTVAAQYYIRSHIAKPYWQTYDVPQTHDSADFVIINISLPLMLSERDHLENYVDGLIKSGKYDVVVNSSGTILFQKKQ